MSKRILFILSLSLLITIIHCASYCETKYAYNFTDPYGEDPFTDGDTRKVWNHEHSCNSLAAEVNETEAREYNANTDTDVAICCYIHIEYESAITGERHDKYGCIDVYNPYEDYNGSIEYVKKKVEKVENQMLGLKTQGDNSVSVVSQDHLHVKIVCGAYFLKISLFALLILILF